MNKVLITILLSLQLVIPLSVDAQVSTADADKSATLIACGEALTQEEALQKALRSAVEQTYGVFVSSNSEVVNDDLVKDEIATVSSGNIKSYQILSSVDAPNGHKIVTVKAVVSIDKIIAYAKNHGMSSEFAGGVFAANIKLKKLNQENEKLAVYNLNGILAAMSYNGLFDYKVKVYDPIEEDNGKYSVPVTVFAYVNQYTNNFFATLGKTISALGIKDDVTSNGIAVEVGGSEPSSDFVIPVYDFLDMGITSFAVKDNVGNEIYPIATHRVLDSEITVYRYVPDSDLPTRFRVGLGEYGNSFEAYGKHYIIDRDSGSSRWKYGFYNYGDHNFELGGYSNGTPMRYPTAFYQVVQDHGCFPTSIRTGIEFSHVSLTLQYNDLDEISKVTSIDVVSVVRSERPFDDYKYFNSYNNE